MVIEETQLFLSQNFLKTMKIETERLLLYPATDSEMLQIIENEKNNIMQQAYKEMFQGCTDFPEKRMWYALWQMELKGQPGTMVGSFCFKGVGKDGSVEIGYGLHDGFCGHGYMTEALNAVAGWALKQPDVMKIIAETDVNNEASQKVLQRAGFHFSGEYGAEGPIFCRLATTHERVNTE